ncbi:MAG: hypothetical protein Q8P61_02170 [Candidatus Nanopelagicales bacterium]|nr:hypothetical protein [Candidatus Nanopelagicales bacterium]
MKGSLEIPVNPADLILIFMGDAEKDGKTVNVWRDGKRTDDLRQLAVGDKGIAYRVPAAVTLGTTYLADATVLGPTKVNAKPGTILKVEGETRLSIRPVDNFTTAVSLECAKITIPNSAVPAPAPAKS